jgi:hypothetical protein
MILLCGPHGGWHSQALPNIGTKAFDEGADFLRAYPYLNRAAPAYKPLVFTRSRL